MIQKVENTTKALSFKRMISDKGHLRLSPQDFPIGSAFRFFSPFGPADSVTLLREAGWIARMGGSDCEGTLILLTVDVLLKHLKLLTWAKQKFQRKICEKITKNKRLFKGKRKELWQSTAFSKMHFPCYHWEAPGFFPLLPGKPMPGTPRIWGSIPTVTPSTALWDRASCGPESSIGWRSKCPTGWGEHVWRTWWRDLASKTGAALAVILCGFEDKHLQVNQHEASKISSIFKPVIMEEIWTKGRLSLLLIHGLSSTIMDYHWWVEIWSPEKYIMNHDAFSILSSSHTRAILKGLHNLITLNSSHKKNRL